MNKKKINNFLRFIGQIAKENSNISFRHPKEDHDLIYHELIKQGIPSRQKKTRIDKTIFPYLVKKNENLSGINVFVDENWKYFCQFQNGLPLSYNNHVKVYLPFDTYHIKHGADLLLDFLRTNDMEFHGKIASEIRFDDIVIRLADPYDLLKLLSFINSNKYIRKNLLQPNPFAFTCNNIAIAFDGSLSYNAVISQYICMYINEIRIYNAFDSISADNFLDFIKNYYNDKFINHKNLKQVFNDFSLPAPMSLMNLKHITELIINNFNENYTLKNFLQQFNLITDKSHIRNEQQSLIHGLYKSTSPLTLEEKFEIHKQLLEAMKELTIKYQNPKIAEERISALLNSGDYNYITRKNGLRTKLLNSNFQSKLLSILNNIKTSFSSYIDNLLNRPKKKSIDNLKTEQLFSEYIAIMTKKRSRDMALANIMEYLNSNESLLITRENNLRERITTSSFKEDLQQILQANNMDIQQYFEYIEKKYSQNNSSSKAK